MSSRDATNVGHGFIIRHGLWSDKELTLAADIQKQVKENEIEVVRFSFADQHGILRGKTLLVDELSSILRNGYNIVSSLLLKDTADIVVFPLFSIGAGTRFTEMEGAADLVMVPDPATFRILPWASKTAWILCDLYFADGKPVPISTRQIYKDALKRLHVAGFEFVAGLEVEFHIFKIENLRLELSDVGQPGEPLEVSLLTQGYRYLSEARFDHIDEILAILRRNLLSLALPLRSLEVEYGPSQCEITIRPATGIECADSMILMRSAIKQICRRHGYHATFMCRPRIPKVLSSGWHLNQSLRDHCNGRNAFANVGSADLSTVGQHYLAGLMAHARAATVFCTPTINGYKRYRSHSMAPDRITWGRDNRGVMMRVLSGLGEMSARIENRVGEPAANPYLYMASQVVSGLAGIRDHLLPGPPVDTPYEVDAPLVPKTLAEAVEALRTDAFFIQEFGSDFIEYFLRIKGSEVSRFNLEVTEWEQREYFEHY